MSGWKPVRLTAESIVRWSLAVKIGGSALGVFWILQTIKDEFVPEPWEDRLRVLNLLPHWPWYAWIIALLCVLLVGTIEGTTRWNKNEVAPILGWPDTLQNEAFLLAKNIRDFIAKFIADNGPIPKVYPTSDEKERILMNAAVSDWCNRFSSLFRVTLSDVVEDTIHKIQGHGIPLDFATIGILSQPTLNPNSVLHLAGQLMAGGLALTLLDKNAKITVPLTIVAPAKT